MDQHRGRSSSRSGVTAKGDTTTWKDPSYWQGIVAEGDGDQLAAEAEAFLQQFETNLPKDMRPGFDTLETVLLDVCRNTSPEVIRESQKAIAEAASIV